MTSWVGAPPRVVDLRDGVPQLPAQPSSQPRAHPQAHPRPTALAWQRPYLAALIVLDALALLLGGAIGLVGRFGPAGSSVTVVQTDWTYGMVLVAAVPVWLAVLAASRAYEPRFLGLGSDEFRRVGNAGLRFIAVLAIACVAFQWVPARRFVAVALPVAALLGLVFRYLARRVLFRLRSRGLATHRVLVVGEGAAGAALIRHLEQARYAGLTVVAVDRPLTGPDGEPSLAHIPDAVARCQADTVAVAHSPGVTSQALRRMSWLLEGSGVDLLLAPALTEVAGPRIQVRPLSGLPLLQIAEPEFAGVRRLAKASLDRAGALTLLVVLAPVMLGLAAAIRLDSPGPAVFRQQRVGRDGRVFTMYKFRSMLAGAAGLQEQVQPHNDHRDGILFKMVDDPRITRVGRWLRRGSLDELPQLVNVLLGRMSLIGPRPPLPSEVARYAPDAHRRLLVRPGMTGLWQVSGRSDLSWQETVRLDLYYVENWSVALDAEIVWKTLFAVARGAGAR